MEKKFLQPGDKPPIKLIDISKKLTESMQDLLIDTYQLNQRESAYVLAMSIHVFTQIVENEIAFKNCLIQLDLLNKIKHESN